MKTNCLSISFFILALVFAQGVSARPDYAGHGKPNFYDYAKVIAVDPIVKYVRVAAPRQECWEERVPAYQSRYTSATPMIVGGIIGGAIGNKVVSGHKDLGIAAGALLGGSVARDLHHRHRSQYGGYSSMQTRCERIIDHHEEERVEGYRVTYRYKGETFTTRTHRDPGDQIKVRVSVKPVY